MIKPINKRLMVEVEATGRKEITASGLHLEYQNDQDEMTMIWTGAVVDYAENCELKWLDSLGKTIIFDKRTAIETKTDSGLWLVKEETVIAIDMES